MIAFTSMHPLWACTVTTTRPGTSATPCSRATASATPKAAKTFIDVKTGEVHSDSYLLEKAVKAIIEEMDENEQEEA